MPHLDGQQDFTETFDDFGRFPILLTTSQEMPPPANADELRHQVFLRKTMRLSEKVFFDLTVHRI
jgi:hypothetical protein